jgi:hypothetical protein
MPAVMADSIANGHTVTWAEEPFNRIAPNPITVVSQIIDAFPELDVSNKSGEGVHLNRCPFHIVGADNDS